MSHFLNQTSPFKRLQVKKKKTDLLPSCPDVKDVFTAASQTRKLLELRTCLSFINERLILK